jgi:hypothetical protein
MVLRLRGDGIVGRIPLGLRNGPRAGKVLWRWQLQISMPSQKHFIRVQDWGARCGSVEVLVDGEWTRIPEGSLVPTEPPDGRIHVCAPRGS